MSEPGTRLSELSVVEIARRTTAGEVSATEVLQSCLERIEELDPELNAFQDVLTDSAMAEAAALDGADAPRGPLHGVPVAIKAEIEVAGSVTTFGGRANRTPAAQDSHVVARLRESGAVIVGITRMPEFGQWPYTESIAGGITRNPWDPTRTPGGSSGGTAVAVASGMVPVGLGGDGGGSIRIPSACCGLFGLKPARGRVSADPAPHLWWGLGTTGPLARSVADSALVYDVIRGNVPSDLFPLDEPAESFTAAAAREPGRLRIGWSTTSPTPGVRPAHQHVRAVEDAARLLADLGHDVHEVDPGYPDITAAFTPQVLGGVRHEADNVEDYSALEPRTRQMYRLGTWATERVAHWALRAGERVATKANRVFDHVDVLLTPSIAHRPRPVGVLDRGNALVQALRAQPMIAYTAIWNVTGNPAAAVPFGLGTDGLPLSVQLVGRRADEATLLSLSAQVEAARPWQQVATVRATAAL